MFGGVPEQERVSQAPPAPVRSNLQLLQMRQQIQDDIGALLPFGAAQIRDRLRGGGGGGGGRGGGRGDRPELRT